MKKETILEILIILITAVPAVYLAVIWADLPEIVPTKWNSAGEVVNTGSRNVYLYMSVIVPFGLYLLLKYSNSFNLSDDKPVMQPQSLLKFRLLMGFFMTVIVGIMPLYSLHSGESVKVEYVVMVVFLLFAGMGNYFQNIEPNAIMGIRVGWTLHNPKVWKETHLMAGRLWFGLGLVAAALGFLLKGRVYLITSVVVFIVLIVVPLWHAYSLHKKYRTE